MMKGQKLPPIFLLLCTVQQVDPGLPATNLIPRISPSLNSPSWNWVSFLLSEQGWWLISAITLECLSLQQLASSVRRGSHRIGFTPLQSTVGKRLQRLSLVTAGEGDATNIQGVEARHAAKWTSDNAQGSPSPPNKELSASTINNTEFWTPAGGFSAPRWGPATPPFLPLVIQP